MPAIPAPITATSQLSLPRARHGGTSLAGSASARRGGTGSARRRIAGVAQLLAEEAAMQRLHQLRLGELLAPQDRALAAPALADEIDDLGEAALRLEVAPLVEVGHRAHGAEGALAGALADAAAQADVGQRRRVAGRAQRGVDGIDGAARHHLALAQQRVLQPVGTHPRARRVARLGPRAFRRHGQAASWR